jgi:guanylate kinase
MKTAGGGAKGRLFVVSGPSGSGKSTIVSRLKELPGIFYSVSVTSRAPRPGEVDGRDYRFVSKARFEEMAAAGEFAEHAEVAGNCYGTPKAALLAALAQGRTALVDIDVQGAMQIRERFADARLIFIEPPTMEALEERLRKRGTESEEAIRRRLELARREMGFAERYDFRVVNDDLAKAVSEVKAIMRE